MSQRYMHIRHEPTVGVAPLVEFSQFLDVDIRVGKVLTAEVLQGARKPAVLTIDFGDAFGVKTS